MRNSIFTTRGAQRRISSDSWFDEIEAGGYRAVIFDCDGTLVDSSAAHFRSVQVALRAQGHDMDSDWYAARTGLDRQSIFQTVANETSKTLDISRASRNSIASFIDHSAAVLPIPETANLVRKLYGTYPMGVGTNAEFEVANASLQAADLLQYFDHILSVSGGYAPKPAPDIFLAATTQLGFSASKTIVFEDSTEGVCAALRAGLDVIKLI